jgi:hypothetical protein
MANEIISFKSLIYHKKDLNMHYVEVSSSLLDMLGEFKRGKFSQRVWIQINDQEKGKWQGGIVALGGGDGYVTVSASRMKKFGIHFGEEVQVYLQKDDSEFGMEVAPEFLAVLDSDPEAKERFDQLSKGFQRYLLYYIIQVKASYKRVDRAIMLLNNLKRTIPGKETFKDLLQKD